MRHDAEFQQRALAGLRAIEARPELAEAVGEGVDEFFAKAPGLSRTLEAEYFVAALVIDRILSAEAEQAAAVSEPKTQKAAA